MLRLDGIRRSWTLSLRTVALGLQGRLGGHLRTPLYRNGYALLASGAITSILGLVYWTLAARLYSAEIVGLNSALLAAMLLLSGLAQLSLNNVLVRFVPVAGPKTARLIGYSYLASACAAAIFSITFIVGVGYFAPALIFLGQSPQWQWSFGLAITAWTIFVLQDSVLTGLRQTTWVPIENTIFAVVKILLLLIFVGVAGRAGIFLSWAVPALLAVIPVNGLIFWRLIPRHVTKADEPSTLPALGKVFRYAGGNYVGSLFFLGYTGLLPLIVANRVGTVATAYFYLPWTLAGGLQLIVSNMATSMTVEAALNQTELRNYCRRVLAHTLRLLVPIVVVILIAAPWFLRIFGGAYASVGLALLRYLSLAAIPNVAVTVSLGILRVQNRSVMIGVVQAVQCAGMLSLSYWLLPQLGITGVGVAWLVSQAAAAAGLFYIVLWPLLRQGKETSTYDQVGLRP
jgi:O-antigen/teichoic acid export membrane protein